MTNEEKKLEAIRIPLDLFARDQIGIYEASEKILEALKQFDPEPLVVEIIETHDACSQLFIVQYTPEYNLNNLLSLAVKTTKKEAIDFCDRHGLRIKK